ncbi:MAG: hypothetical protein IT379_10660, partial [Deltaproteobacteria bacterium]|nr:hypothetical protein [Deltaproteobacteria bacterium]
MFPATFDLMPTITHTCTSLVAEAFYTISSITFTVAGPILQGGVAPMPRAGCATLSQSPVPGDGSFDIVCEVTGECVETFRLMGRFTDRDHLTATFSATYVSSPGAIIGCGEGLGARLCGDQTVTVSGTRRP